MLQLETKTTGSTIIPSYILPVRLYGNSAIIKNNEFWKRFMIGGTFGTSSFEGVYTNNVYKNLNFTYNTAYTAKEFNKFSELNTSHGEAPVEISAKYNYYLPQYEKHINTFNSVKMIPNAYLLAERQFTNWALSEDSATLQHTYSAGVVSQILSKDTSLTNFITLENNALVDTLFAETAVSYLPPISNLYETVDATNPTAEGLYLDHTANLRQYLNETLPNTTISASTMDRVTRLGNNIIFDDRAMSTTFKSVEEQASKLPYYVNINIPIVRQNEVMGTYGTNRIFADMLEENLLNSTTTDEVPNFVPLFMRMLKEHFADNRGMLGTLPCQNYKTRQEADLATKKVSEISEVENQRFATLDLVSALIANYNDVMPAYGEGEKNYILINTNEYTENMVANIGSAYRYINSQLTLLFLNKALNKVSFPNPLFLQNIGTMMDPNPPAGLPADVTIDYGFLYRLYGMAGTTNYNETIAYRIVKIAGNASGESNTQNIVQNIWLYNYNNENLSIDHHNFIDTQIGYGENITYKIYAYVINVGAKYKASDLILSRNIGQGSGPLDWAQCIEYYEPTTGNPTKPLATAFDPSLTDLQFGAFSPNVSVSSENLLYQADYNLNFEPTIEIVEVPLFEKTISVLDNPAHAHDVVPFQKMNNSHEIGFLLNTESFVVGPMPAPLTAADQTYKEAYLESQDIIEGGNITKATKSPHAMLMIYRMTEKPQNLQDFATNQYAQKDLTEVAQGAFNPKCVFYDKLKTNQKYYYLFRFFNQHGAMGHLSPIVEAELVSDGSYVYSTFEVLPVEQLSDPRDINPSIPLKKLLSIIPNVNQLMLDTTDVDFSQPAETQLQNLNVGSADLSELLWGRDFKIRLTSTKTGKKIDLNLKFHINEET